MAKVILGLDNIGYNLMNEIRLFNDAIGQPLDSAVNFNIYREIMHQIVSAYSDDMEITTQQLGMIPQWPTILYIEDQNEFFDIKREFAARIRLAAMSIYALFKQHLGIHPGIRHTVLVDSVTVTILIVNVFIDADHL